jgi:hypothetical protein
MNCTRCGKEIPDGENKLCEDCQKSLLSEISSSESEESKFQVVKEESGKEKKSKSESKEKSSKKINFKVAILAIIIAILLVLVIIQLSTKSVSNFISDNISSENSVGNTIGNIRNYGYAATEKNWIYYVSPNEDGTCIRINKIKKDGSYKQVLLEEDADIDVISLNVIDGYIYFITISTSTTSLSDALSSDESASLDYVDNKIWKMKTDGSDLQVINDNNFSNDDYEIYVIKDKVYYIGDDYNIYSMDTNGENITQINKNKTGFLGISDKYILFNDYPENTAEEDEDSTDYVTYVMNLDGSNARAVNGDRLYSITLDGDYIYYTDSEKNICKIKVDGTSQETVLETSAYNMNLNGDYIYYLNYKDADSEDNPDYTVCVFRTKKDGTDNQIIKELNTYSSFLDIVGMQVFYMDSSKSEGFINLVDSKTLTEIELYSISYDTYDEEGDYDQDADDTDFEDTDSTDETDE